MKSEFIPPIGKILQISGKCISLIGDDIDTDRIIPARFLKCVNFDSLGKSVFADDRKTLKGFHPFDLKENEGASILVVNSNFGCGSSREHAVWALRDFGFKSVIASSFGDIFYNNCFKNSVLPIKLSREQINHLFEVSNFAPTSFEIDLLKKELKYKGDSSYMFDVKDSLLDRIINNLDDVDMTLKHKKHIQAFEQKRRNQRPWLFDYSN